MSTEHVAIVFVSYNCGADIAQLIRQIDELPHDGFRLSYVVVDNASTDDSVEQLRALNVDHTTIVPSPVNLGFGAGCNLAFKQIESCDKVLLLNPDVEVFEDSIQALFDASLSDPAAKIWGGVTLNPDGAPDCQSAWREPTLRSVIGWALFIDVLHQRWRGYSILSYPDLVGQRSVDSISGCFLLIDHQLLSSLEGFDERFFMYSEEIDLCRRAREMGASPTQYASARVVHIGSATVSSFNKLRFLYQSKLKYCRKYWPTIPYQLAVFCTRLGVHLRVIGLRIKHWLSKSEATKAKAQQWRQILVTREVWSDHG